MDIVTDKIRAGYLFFILNFDIPKWKFKLYVIVMSVLIKKVPV